VPLPHLLPTLPVQRLHMLQTVERAIDSSRHPHPIVVKNKKMSPFSRLQVDPETCSPSFAPSGTLSIEACALCFGSPLVLLMCRGRLQPEFGGGEIAVKVQRPGVLLSVALDLFLMRWVADKVDGYVSYQCLTLNETRTHPGEDTHARSTYHEKNR